MLEDSSLTGAPLRADSPEIVSACVGEAVSDARRDGDEWAARPVDFAPLETGVFEPPFLVGRPVAEGPAAAGGAATAAADGGGAFFVTRPPENPEGAGPEVIRPDFISPDVVASDLISPVHTVPEGEPSAGKILSAGTDTLDFGADVQFGRHWPAIVQRLARLKQQARGTKGLPLGNGRCLLLPGGKANYPFHLQFPGFQVWLSPRQQPQGITPNVFVSVNSRLLWEQGDEAAVALVKAELLALGDGVVRETRINRGDLAVDVLIPGGLTESRTVHGGG